MHDIGIQQKQNSCVMKGIRFARKVPYLYNISLSLYIFCATNENIDLDHIVCRLLKATLQSLVACDDLVILVLIHLSNFS